MSQPANVRFDLEYDDEKCNWTEIEKREHHSCDRRSTDRFGTVTARNETTRMSDMQS
jgi:hypothetical protein